MRQKLLRLIVSLTSIYLILAGFLYLFQRDLLFIVKAGGINQSVEQIVLNNNEHELHGYVLHPGMQHAVIYFGGNAEKAMDNLQLYNDIFDDITVYMFDYRGYGQSEGSPSQNAFFTDALLIYDQIAANHDHVSIIGRSLGSGVASFLATQRNINKLVLVTPYDSITNVAQDRYFMFPVRLLIKDPFESWRYAPNITAETLILMAEADHIVPHKHTEALASYINKNILRTITVADSNHITIVDQADYAASLLGFLDN